MKTIISAALGAVGGFLLGGPMGAAIGGAVGYGVGKIYEEKPVRSYGVWQIVAVPGGAAPNAPKIGEVVAFSLREEGGPNVLIAYATVVAYRAENGLVEARAYTYTRTSVWGAVLPPMPPTNLLWLVGTGEYVPPSLVSTVFT